MSRRCPGSSRSWRATGPATSPAPRSTSPAGWASTCEDGGRGRSLMCRLLGWVAKDGLSLRDVLGEESFVAFAQLSRIHADGWGLAYAAGDELEVERSTTNASADPAFAAVATDAVARAGLAHLRWASPGLPVELCNAHPFRWGTDGVRAQRRHLPVRPGR